MALVDTTGRISELTVVGGSGEQGFERAAMDAVWQAKFRPYRIEGEVREAVDSCPQTALSLVED